MHEYELRLNGKTFIRGDATSIRVVFQNLSGANFVNPPSWASNTHGDYLLMMSATLGLVWAGELALICDGEVVETHTFVVNEAEQTSELRLNGEPLLVGDDATMEAIFNSLFGARSKPGAPIDVRQLQAMGEYYGVTMAGSLSLCRGGDVVDTHHFLPAPATS